MQLLADPLITANQQHAPCRGEPVLNLIEGFEQIAMAFIANEICIHREHQGIARKPQCAARLHSHRLVDERGGCHAIVNQPDLGIVTALAQQI
jgi:hypothetical protein